MSFGIATDVVDDSDSAPAVEAVCEAICPYVKAFPSPESCESWAAGVNVATVGLPLTEGLAVAAALTGETGLSSSHQASSDDTSQECVPK